MIVFLSKFSSSPQLSFVSSLLPKTHLYWYNNLDSISMKRIYLMCLQWSWLQNSPLSFFFVFLKSFLELTFNHSLSPHHLLNFLNPVLIYLLYSLRIIFSSHNSAVHLVELSSSFNHSYFRISTFIWSTLEYSFSFSAITLHMSY